jgi:hypothetical protein
MKKILFFFLLLPALASAQTAKDTVNVLSDDEISQGTARDSLKFYYVEGTWKKLRLDSLAKYTRVKLVGDKGDITVSNNGDTWSIDAGAVVWEDLAQAVKDSIGAGGGGGGVTSITAGTGLTGGTITTSGTIAADTNFLITVYDTAAMLSPYLLEADTLTLSNRINLKLNISDTTAMLAPYLRAADTLTLSNRINLKQNILIAGTGIGISNDTISWTGSGGVADGDKGDIDVTSSGTVWTIDTAAVTGLKIASTTVTGDKLAITGISGDAAHLVGAISGGNADTVRVGSGLQLSSGELRADTAAMIIACSDETTAITTGNEKVTFRMPFNVTIIGVAGSLSTASSSGLPEFDINGVGGTTIFTTKPTIDANEKTTYEATTASVLDSTKVNIPRDTEMTIDIDTAGTGAKGLKVTILYRKN